MFRRLVERARAGQRSRRRATVPLIVATVVAALAACTAPSPRASPSPSTSPFPSPSSSPSGAPLIHVAGNQIVDQNGAVFQPRGVNRSGAEYMCIEGGGFFDGPTDDSTSIAAMRSWRINTVRLPLNEDC